MEQLEVLYFLHHFITHTVVWEIYETDYASLEEVKTSMPAERFIEGADGKTYMVYQPRMMNRDQAESYTDVKDGSYQRYTVITVE